MADEYDLISQYAETHHAVARMFAAGCSPSKIRQTLGISTRRLTLLWNDPTFQELIAIKAQKLADREEEVLESIHDLGVGNLHTAQRLLAAKLNHQEEVALETGEFPPTRDLLQVSADLMDRFGFSKHSTVQHNHDFAISLDKAIARSQKVIEARAVEVPSLPVAEEAPIQPPCPKAPAELVPPAQEAPRPGGRMSSPGPTRPSLSDVLGRTNRRRVA